MNESCPLKLAEDHQVGNRSATKWKLAAAQVSGDLQTQETGHCRVLLHQQGSFDETEGRKQVE